jgi:hypothetical protein
MCDMAELQRKKPVRILGRRVLDRPADCDMARAVRDMARPRYRSARTASLGIGPCGPADADGLGLGESGERHAGQGHGGGGAGDEAAAVQDRRFAGHVQVPVSG